MAVNERITENLIRDAFVDLGYREHPDLVVEEQSSRSAEIARLLRTASKTGRGGKGSPEFIVTSTITTDIVLVVECKATTNRHESENRDRPVDFAVDGVLSYARALSRSFHVIAVASSGSNADELVTSTFLHPKGESVARELKARSGAVLDRVVPWEDYKDAAQFDPDVERVRWEDLLEFSRELHDYMRDYAKLTESEKPLLVSGTLLALMNEPFRASYGAHTADSLQRAWMQAITNQIEAAKIPQAKKRNIYQPYSSISVHPELGKQTKEYPKGILHELIRQLSEKVLPLMETYRDYDVVGSFYGEFLKYTGGDKKSLGIVLTPRHITDLFCRLSQVTKRDVVVDTCAGTGGFLISAMSRMLSQCGTESERDGVKQNQLVGVEHQPNMYTLAASNMIFRGDGKANLYQGSCFDEPIIDAVKNKHRPTVGLINPPYSQKGEGLSELDFVETMLDTLQPGGRGLAIVPTSCATGTTGKVSLLKKHRLEAVMSMPIELFSPVGVVTCVMVFTAHEPHADTPDRKSWFGYWREDGFVKTKHKGRIDQKDVWEGVRDHWVSSYVNRVVKPGESVMQRVGPLDEWVAEAYMETDYSEIGADDFESFVRDFLLYKLTSNAGGDSDAQ